MSYIRDLRKQITQLFPILWSDPNFREKCRPAAPKGRTTLNRTLAAQMMQAYAVENHIAIVEHADLFDILVELRMLIQHKIDETA
jgi:hypothetical protein